MLASWCGDMALAPCPVGCVSCSREKSASELTKSASMCSGDSHVVSPIGASVAVQAGSSD